MKNALILNHPDNIRTNRNKVAALAKLAAGGVNVAPFTENFKSAGTANFQFPLVARTKYHQGGAGFWLCLTPGMIAKAVKDGAQYIQSFIDIKDEYRLHVVGDEVIYGVRKVERDNHADAFVEHYTEYAQNKADKDNAKLDKATMEFVLRKLARKLATGPDMVIRSNTRGWKFSKVANENLDKGLVTEAVKAVKALGLNFAAVDCCIDSTGKAFVIECNSGPGLDGTSFDAWTAALKKLVAPKVAKKVEAKAAPAAPVAGVNAAAVKLGGGAAAKQRLKDRAALLAQLADAADDDADAEVLEKLMKKAGL